MKTPTLDVLLDKFRDLIRDPEFIEHGESFEKQMRLIASGQANPLLLQDNAVVAAQCLIVILEHAKRMEGRGYERPSNAKCN